MKPRFTNLFGHTGYGLLILLLSARLLPVHAQNKPAADARITNIRLNAVDQTSLEILYDLAVSAPGDSVYFDVTGHRSGLLSVNPGFVEGDFGRHVRAGSNRRIIWNVLANGYELNEEIRVRVRVLSGLSTTVARDSGTVSTPADAVAAHRPNRPGTGNGVALGAGTGFGQCFRAGPQTQSRAAATADGWRGDGTGVWFQPAPSGIQAIHPVRTAEKSAEGEPYFQQANQQHHRYYLATRAAAALWLGDVVATLIRGMRNRESRREPSPIQVRPAYQANTPVAALTLRF